MPSCPPMQRIARGRTGRVLGLALLLLSTSCAGTKGSTRPANDGPWLAGSPEFQRQIERHAARLPYLQRLEEFMEEITWFVRAGEPAYGTLLELAASEDTKVAGTALTALGGSGDARLVPYMNKIPWPEGEGTERLAYERARAHVRLGDWSRLDVLIQGLSDDNLYARSLCFKALRDATGEGFAYHPQSEADVREASITRWQGWNERRSGDLIQR
jgi:hypothetical protein